MRCTLLGTARQQPSICFGQFRGRELKDYRRSDERIREDVSNRLSHNSSIDASEIQVGVQRAEVILSGRVDSRKVDAIMPKSMRRRFRGPQCAEQIHVPASKPRSWEAAFKSR
ncbi:BON domain-containing protein [Sinorhizobium meliloti]|uniref:BON domain-containing protein n=1 Tax=Rhizobium meliloti TaxID=382 RepID=UPI001F3098F9|nr:BON domain-containing protein [Sinorhizobium meliloti]